MAGTWVIYVASAIVVFLVLNVIVVALFAAFSRYDDPGDYQ